MMVFAQAARKLEFEKVLQRVMRYAVSDPGREALASQTFATRPAEINAELAVVSEFKRFLEEEDAYPLEGVHAIRSLAAKASVEGSVLQPAELLRVASTLRAARTGRAAIGKVRDRYPLIWAIADPIFTDKVLEYNIGQAIDDSAAVRASASKDLQSIRRAISERYSQLRTRLERILKGVSDLGFSQEDIITTREGRMVIPVKSEHKHHVPGFIHSASASGATVFIEPTETLELNNEIRSLHFEEQREIERILRMLTEQVGALRPHLEANEERLARLDAVHAKAKYSIEVLGVAPPVTESGPVRLVGARHPILLINHGYKDTVPLDLEVGGDYATLVISGPNAGGKSVAMKCVGLLVLMTQAGMHIPAGDQSVVRTFRRMFVDIGDDQSIDNDLSTFSSHLMNLREIETQADGDSLVLIDEIGSGTDPSEGGAIAAALLEALTARGAHTIATTHHGVLKVFAHETPGVENGAMEFDQETLTPTYRFRAGIPGSSYALEMAGRLGMREDLLRRSRERMGQQQTKLDSLITELESSAQKYRREVDELHIERNRLNELVQQYESKLAHQAKELRELKRKALEEAKEIVEQANAVIERSVKEIRETAADQGAVKEARAQVASVRREILNKEEALAPTAPPEEQGALDVGSAVALRGQASSGEVESIAPDRKSAIVVFGNIRMRVPLSDLRPVRSAQQPRTVETYEFPEKSAAALEGLDLRGMTGEEALPLVDKFLDDAMLAGLRRVDIIHGKGTGALRKKVTEFLSHHPRVKSYRLAEWNEGGTGATVVELKEN